MEVNILKMNSKNKAGRPKCIRKVETLPEVNYFKPRGIPLTQLETVELKVEEFEAMKLVYYDKLRRGKAAEKMGVSRRTMTRELKSGLEKVIDALLHGKAVEIKGGYYLAEGETIFRCLNDQYEWKAHKSSEKPKECPECGGTEIKKKKI